MTTSPHPAPTSYVAVAVSGGGRSLENLLARARAGANYEVRAVIASNESCRGATIAKEHGLPLFVERFVPRPSNDMRERLYRWLEHHRIGWVALAGFLKPFPIQPGWAKRIVNIHPALLPRFGGQGMYGINVHKAVLAAGESLTGASIHFVNERYDEGMVIASIAVAVHPQDRPEDLAARVFQAECELYPQVLNKLVTGDLPLPDGVVERLTFHE